MRTVLASLLFWSVAAVDATGAPDLVRPLSVGFLTLEGVYNSELMAPWDIFHHTVFHAKPGMRVKYVSMKRSRSP